MTIQEYNKTFRQHLHQVVEKYVKEKYKDDEKVLCYFEPYFVDEEEELSHCYDNELVWLSKEEYISLLFVVVIHRGITFEELPLYIPIDLYKRLIGAFRFIHFLGQEDHPIALEENSSPMAIVMRTLKDDVNEIIGDEMTSILVQSCGKCKEFHLANVHVEIWMGVAEVNIYRYEDEEKKTCKHNIYGMIDAKAFLSALHVQSCDEVAEILWKMCEEYTSKNKTDITWLVRWLNTNGIKYVHGEGVQHKEYDRGQSVYK